MVLGGLQYDPYSERLRKPNSQMRPSAVIAPVNMNEPAISTTRFRLAKTAAAGSRSLAAHVASLGAPDLVNRLESPALGKAYSSPSLLGGYRSAARMAAGLAPVRPILVGVREQNRVRLKALPRTPGSRHLNAGRL